MRSAEKRPNVLTALQRDNNATLSVVPGGERRFFRLAEVLAWTVVSAAAGKGKREPGFPLDFFPAWQYNMMILY